LVGVATIADPIACGAERISVPEKMTDKISYRDMVGVKHNTRKMTCNLRYIDFHRWVK
jgi:hypothetical protein